MTAVEKDTYFGSLQCRRRYQNSATGKYEQCKGAHATDSCPHAPQAYVCMADMNDINDHMDALGHIDEHLAQALDHSLDANTDTADIDALELVLFFCPVGGW